MAGQTSPVNDFRLRALSALVIFLPAAVLIWTGGPGFSLFVLAIALALGWELAAVPRGGALRAEARRGFSGGIADIVLYTAVGVPVVSAAAGQVLPGVAAALIGAVLVILTSSREPTRATRAAGALYIAVACAGIVWLRQDALAGRELVVWLVLVVIATDIGAYFAGRAIGGPKLAPRISPQKTWAGLLGGMAAAALAGLGLTVWQGGPGVMEAMAVSAGLAVVAQIGDLLESFVKRIHNLKDSSDLIPGHGGVFDRADGLLAVALVTFVFTFLWYNN